MRQVLMLIALFTSFISTSANADVPVRPGLNCNSQDLVLNEYGAATLFENDKVSVGVAVDYLDEQGNAFIYINYSFKSVSQQLTEVQANGFNLVMSRVDIPGYQYASVSCRIKK